MPPRAAVPQAGPARFVRGAERGVAWVIALIAVSVIVAMLPQVAVRVLAQRVHSEAEEAARSAQRQFEALRRFELPRIAPRLDRCDVTIGRLCYWDDNSDSPLPAERADVGRARVRLRASLDSLGAREPTSDYITGQRVRYALEADDAPTAVALLDRCAATPWWCQALRGLAWHRAGDESRSAAAFDTALSTMPDKLRCAWLDVRDWVPFDPHVADSRQSECSGRQRLSARVFWLAAPLLSWRPNATRDEFLSRRTLGTTLAGTATPHHMSWGSDMADASLRYGWPDRWAREDDPPITRGPPDVRVVGDEPSPSFSLVPNRHALESPFDALPNDWRLVKDPDPPMRYAPGWLRAVDSLPVQIARFRRAGGDSMIVVAVYDARGSLREDHARVRATAMLTTAPDTTLAAGSVLTQPFGVITFESPARPALAAVEVVDSANGRAARWRAGLAALAPSAIISDLLVGLAGSERLPLTLDSAVSHVMASLRVSAHDTISLYWESYAHATPDEPARVALRLTPLQGGGGVWGAIARSLGLAHTHLPLALSWHDPGPADAAVGRSLRVGIPDVPPGRYRIELIVESRGARGAAAREISVVPPPGF